MPPPEQAALAAPKPASIKAFFESGTDLLQKPKVKAAVKKAPAKKLTQTTLKTKAAPKKRAKPDSDDDDAASTFSNTPPSAKKLKKAPAAKKSSGNPLAEIENDSMAVDDDDEPPASAPKTKKNATDTYQKLTQLEHIIKRPDTYIGSVEPTEQPMWVFNKETKLMEYRKVTFVPGLYKIFDEILVNAADNKQRDATMTYMKVTVDRENGEISVENNGKGIPVEIHGKEKIYIPEMIFGHLLTGSNYDDDEKKTVGGRNGYGAKLCNVFSEQFTLECQDSNNGKRYKQVWTDNMSKCGKAKITSSKTSDFVRVTFKPDFKRFSMTGIDDDLESLIQRRVYDMAGTVRGIKVYLNGTHIKLAFKGYCEMYAKAIAKERGAEEGVEPKVVVEVDKTDAHPRWEIAFTVSDGSFQQVSFVNSIATTSGGTHVNYVADQITGSLLKTLDKKKKGHALKQNHIRNHIFIFVNCLVNNPAFTSQTKEQMTTKVSQFGSKCALTEEFLKKIAKSDAIQNIIDFAEKKADKMMAKSDGNKRSRISNSKLVDANLAGTRHGHECTLILTEGDSAKSLAVAGRAILDPDRIGVFPLRGKMLNVRDASIDQITKNQEIQNIKQFLGLKHKAVYNDTKGLRYGHLMIMADQDHDGSHIKGLLINFLQVQYPSLLQIPDFFREFITPIVKVWQGPNPKKPQRLKSFFTQPQYEEWKDSHKSELSRWHYKYFKGLGTSSNEDAQVYFTNLDDHLKEFNTMQPDEADLFELAFSKKKADARKEWLGNFVPGTYLDHSTKSITYTDFVNKELILFSMADNMRSIPSVIDGLKPGQRKVMYACFKRNLVKDQKVIELAGYVSEQTSYHHGEVSLQQTIIGLAQNFVGSNNINCLEPSGNFGSRLAGGSDAASPRYIHTRLSPFARKIFSTLDEPNLEPQYEDGKRIEPKVYAPVIPMILCNGADGIGTGWSTSVPNYHPVQIVENLKRRMGRLTPDNPEGAPFEPMMPWFRGWKGTPQVAEKDRYKFNGICELDEKTGEVVITELPIRMWTDDFKAKLEEVISGTKGPVWIKDYKEFNDHKNVHFVIQMDDKHTKDVMADGLMERFKLNKQIATSNLVAFDTRGQIRKYENVEEILEEFYHYRLDMYAERKKHWLGVYHADFRKLSEQARFIREIIDGKLTISKKKKTVLVEELAKRKYEPFPKNKDKEVKKKNTDEEMEGGDEEDEEGGDEQANAYDYLLSMPLWSLTYERLERLQRQIDNKKAEHDALLALSEKDLWCQDLDDFVAEWENQMALDAEIQTSIRRLGRRVSKKIGAGKGRKAKKDDDDYEPERKRAGAKLKAAAAPKVTEKAAERFAAMFEKQKTKTKAKEDAGSDAFSDDDFAALGKKGASKPAATADKPQRAATTKKKPIYTLSDTDDDDEDFASLGKTNSAAPVESAAEESSTQSQKSAATKKPSPRIEELEDSEDDFENIGKKSTSEKPAPIEPGSKSNASRTQRAASTKKYIIDDLSDEDEDDFESTGKKSVSAEPAPAKPSTNSTAGRGQRAATTKKRSYIIDDESDESGTEGGQIGDIGSLVRGIAGSAKESQSGRLSLFAMNRPDGHDSTLPKIKTKVSRTFGGDDEEVDDTNYELLARSSPHKTMTKEDDIDSFLSDDGAPPAKASKASKAAPATAAPIKKRGRPAGSKNKSKDAEAPAAAKPKPKPKAAAKPTTLSPAAKAYAAKKASSKRVLSDDEDEDVDMEDPESPPRPAARGRPGRAAATKAKAKPKYDFGDSDDADEPSDDPFDMDESD
ncbi:DNA topoisomerase 2 [Colletotrichum truncatum]|uniref:DNA topoisomerase 2 n=1 Tax=Colletotrichum truncatum TaxID=5467 RepID=A0ACC3YMM9_COLTU|nr:DNA topoisomerase 2 [Colletotrichum truncatum]KAF6792190.1 DNA topoisomerase 2 [Colletotrichum truncatum]